MRKHPLKMTNYNMFTFATTNKQTKELSNTSSTCKQAKISVMMAVGGARCISQATVDKLVIDLICEGQQIFSLVKQAAFKELVTTLHPQCKVISRPTVRLRIYEAANHTKKTVMAQHGRVHYVATTTDWTAHQRSYIRVKSLDRLRNTETFCCTHLQEIDRFPHM